MARPKIHPAIGLTPVANGYLGYNAESGRLHELPPLAALAAELADGSRTEEEITALLAPMIPKDQQDGIHAWFEEGYRSGLLIDCEPEPARWLSAAELHELADKLAQDDRGELAIEVQEKATERAPGEAGYWHQLGYLQQLWGSREKAVEAFSRYAELRPEDAYMQHRLKALRGEAAPERASDESMVQEFDDFSANYDAKMLERLKYEAPRRLVEKLWEAAGSPGGLDCLDLGCGTGLVGVGLRAHARFLCGIDLSGGMLALANERGIYDYLEEAEIIHWLENGSEKAPASRVFDVATAADCFVYFGDMTRVTAAVARRLKPGGWFAFTVERGENFPHELSISGRYTHHADHLREAAKAAGLEVRLLEEGFLRYEGGAAVTGIYTVLRKPPLRG